MIIKIKICFFLLSIISISCLDDNLIPIDKIELDQTAEILRYLESIGDYSNTELAPALVSASEIFSNSSQYFILDIREPAEYLVGHIEGAINISNSNLYDTVDSLYTFNPVKNIAIVSQNGQASSYFTCLLRLAGYNNVYSLNYGMASWNMFFADEWFGALDTVSQSFTNIEFPKKPFTHLPKLEFPAEIVSTKEKTIYRVKEIIKKGFAKDINYSENISSGIANTHFLICYGPVRLYNEFKVGGKGHPENTVWFKDASLFEFRSVYSLQTLPNDQPILIYSGDGQLSASMVAYLTVLGYNVKTLLFGANQLFYLRLDEEPALNQYIFSIHDVMNYPYVTGN